MPDGNFLGNVTVSWKQLVLGTVFKTGKSKWEISCKKEKINTEKRMKKRKRKKKD
jgi:hypothetical protein